MLTQVPAEQKSFLTFNGFFTNINKQASNGLLSVYSKPSNDPSFSFLERIAWVRDRRIVTVQVRPK